tara:strand:- start:12 stop:254 length:243 start_codon:yes stop_codon:yes gene_type:complete
MGLRDKIIMSHVKRIIQTILMVGGCIVIISTILYFYTDDQIKQPYEDKYVPRDTTVHESDNMIYWEWDSVMDSVDMECGG